jgi:hypothetical protein
MERSWSSGRHDPSQLRQDHWLENSCGNSSFPISRDLHCPFLSWVVIRRVTVFDAALWDHFLACNGVSAMRPYRRLTESAPISPMIKQTVLCYESCNAYSTISETQCLESLNAVQTEAHRRLVNQALFVFAKSLIRRPASSGPCSP